MTIRPRDLTANDLVLSYFSLPMRHPIEDRIALAAAAGFAGIGLYIGEYQRLVAEDRASVRRRVHRRVPTRPVARPDAARLRRRCDGSARAARQTQAPAAQGRP